MNSLLVALLVAVSPLCLWAASQQAANRAVYHTVNRPYNYRPYGVDNHDAYKTYHEEDVETFGAYPWTEDFGTQRLHLSGGIYRPYGYDDYDDGATYSHYGNGYRPSYGSARYGQPSYGRRY